MATEQEKCDNMSISPFEVQLLGKVQKAVSGRSICMHFSPLTLAHIGFIQNFKLGGGGGTLTCEAWLTRRGASNCLTF